MEQVALRFYFGPSDGALSQKAYQDVIKRSLAHPEGNFLVIVPDQFTMQTQKELATMHPSGGILNVDVLSFGRLPHRVLEEVDCREIPVLDDTGKSLVLQKVQANLKDQLPVLGGFLHRQGYVHEVKSAISEFMQYGLSPKDVGD
ncbi:MAG: helicase-exonuclease AddAB subunit AddB, partial [Lachnospiraceae bacterium]|nr:helicase-exonuclease AddAB subunit AddB [Lachnospiraceae bacterium]